MQFIVYPWACVLSCNLAWVSVGVTTFICPNLFVGHVLPPDTWSMESHSFAWSLCVRVCICSCACMCAAMCIHGSTTCNVCLWVCASVPVCVHYCRALAWVAAGSSMTLHVCAWHRATCACMSGCR